ncbi:MAG: hypothetical protein AAGA75_02580 [Cyanobacteria bacterium P01_E01_bin.6]
MVDTISSQEMEDLTEYGSLSTSFEFLVTKNTFFCAQKSHTHHHQLTLLGQHRVAIATHV